MSDVLDPLQELLRSTVNCLDKLAAQVRGGKADAGDFHRARAALAWLPLSTSEFALATKRLGNARRYLLIGEPGAASYELRLLIQSLRFGNLA